MNIKELVESWEGKSKEQIIESLMNELKEINKEEKINKRWEPEIGETYYYSHSLGLVSSAIWDNNRADDWRYLTGNVFKTEQGAKEYRKKLEIQAQFKNFVEERNEELDWEDDNQCKYYLYYNYYLKQIMIGNIWICKYSFQVFASSEQILRDAIAEIGEENVKKYVLEV